MPYNGETFRQIKKFKKLEVLRMENLEEKPILSASDFEGLPSNLKRIDLIGAKMTFSTFSRLMENCPSLDVLGIGDIYYNKEASKFFIEIFLIAHTHTKLLYFNYFLNKFINANL